MAADFARRRALMLAPSARYDEILRTPKDGNLGAALGAAMEEIERASPPLAGQLPKDYARFDNDGEIQVRESHASIETTRGKAVMLREDLMAKG